MLVVCWSPKGGSGTSVFSASLALVLAERSPTVLADLAGDQPTLIGAAEPDGVGLADWLAAGTAAPAEAVARLAIAAAPGLDLIPRGLAGQSVATAPAAAGAACAAALHDLDRTVVVDAGRAESPAARAIAGAADAVVVVVRPCYLALRNCVAHPMLLGTTHCVVVGEPGRAISARDIHRVLRVDVTAVVRVRPQIARVIDAGLLTARMPEELSRAAQRVVSALDPTNVAAAAVPRPRRAWRAA